MENKRNSSIKKAKLIITIVDRNKTEFYADVISGFESNLQMVMYGNGTAPNGVLQSLGLNNEKGIIFSVVRNDLIKKVLNTLEDKFKSIRNGKGVAVVVPISSVMGLSIYQFIFPFQKNTHHKCYTLNTHIFLITPLL